MSPKRRDGQSKRGIDELAVFGGPRLFPVPLHVGRPNIPDRARLFTRLNDMLDRRWLTNNGVFVMEFERHIASLAGSKHCVAVANATLGLQLLVRALGWKGEVILPSFTFVATAHALLWEGITPVFADLAKGSFCLDPAAVQSLVTPRTTAILPVHVFGEVSDFRGLEAIARSHNLSIAYDAAHAFGCRPPGRAIGSLGRASVFSFHATKFINAFEGGAVVTDDDQLADQLRLLRNFGFSDEDTVSTLGINAKMSEASAAMGLASLESMDEFISTNRLRREQYVSELDGIPGLTVAAQTGQEGSNFQYLVLEINSADAGISRDHLRSLLHAEGALARRYFYPGCHRSEPYRSLFPDIGDRLPRTERLAGQVLSMPTGSGTTEDEISLLCALIRFILGHARSIRERMGQ